MSDILDDIGGVVKAVAPTIATLLGGPLAGTAVSALSQAIFGKDDASTDEIAQAIKAGQLTPEQLAAIRQSDNDLKAKLAELELRPEELAVEDRKSARDMQVATKSGVPGLLAMTIIVGFFGILIGLMAGVLSVANDQALLLLLGALAAAFGGVVNYYYGSSSGSADKAHQIATIIGARK